MKAKTDDALDPAIGFWSMIPTTLRWSGDVVTAKTIVRLFSQNKTVHLFDPYRFLMRSNTTKTTAAQTGKSTVNTRWDMMVCFHAQMASLHTALTCINTSHASLGHQTERFLPSRNARATIKQVGFAPAQEYTLAVAQGQEP